jgi:hypothetical protein
LSLLQDFDRIVLDEAVLGVARMFRALPSLVLNYIKDCQFILEEIVSADRTKNNNKMAKLSN